jgi:hypothetical protein
MDFLPILNHNDARDGDGYRHGKRSGHGQRQPEREQGNRYQRFTEAEG